MVAVTNPQPVILRPDNSRAVGIAIYALLIAVYVVGWAFAIFGMIRLRRDGYPRWATAVLILSVVFTPLAGVVVYLVARTNGMPVQPLGG